MIRCLAVVVFFQALLPPGQIGAADADLIIPTPSLPKPDYLNPMIDPEFGSIVTRVTGDPGSLIPNLDARWDSVARHQYSKNAVWNSDESLLFLGRHHGFPSLLFLDGETYEPLFGNNAPPGTELRWHPSKPEVMVFTSNNQIGFWSIRSNDSEIVVTFDNISELSIGPWEGNISHDGRRIGLLGKKEGDQVAFVFDFESEQKFPNLVLNEVTVDWVSVSSSGNFLVVNGAFTGSPGDQTQIYDVSGRKVGPLWSEHGRPSHYDLALDENGEDIAVGVSKVKPDDGRVIKRRLKDGKVTALTSGGYASHVSTRNFGRPGWAYVTYQHRGPTWPPYWDEVIAVKLDGSQEVERIAHLHTVVDDYLTEAHAVPSPSGSRVLWAGNWDAAEGRPVSTFVADRRN